MKNKLLILVYIIVGGFCLFLFAFGTKEIMELNNPETSCTPEQMALSLATDKGLEMVVDTPERIMQKAKLVEDPTGVVIDESSIKNIYELVDQNTGKTVFNIIEFNSHEDFSIFVEKIVPVFNDVGLDYAVDDANSLVYLGMKQFNTFETYHKFLISLSCTN